ncbi:potassium channel family protein [Pelotomaculum propionicicum]|uniref:potassium channel family protein n=1 Tax=Pelotomaculum propionicicum TaxID=258475 RepID=UPI003B79D322
MTSIRPILYAFLFLITFISSAVFYYCEFEQKSFMDAVWLTMSSVTTTGYNDVMPVTKTGRIITILLSVLGFGFLTFVLSTFLTGMVEGRISGVWGKRKMAREIAKLINHIIVCGAGRVGREVVSELLQEKQQFVVIEKDPARLAELREEGVLFIAGDATEDRNLLAAGINKARGVITTLADDAGNLMIIITCKDFNPAAHVVTRANRPESIVRLKRAGADTVVCPSAIAGNRMALASTKPTSVAVVETIVEDRNNNLNLEELVISEHSTLVGKEIRESRLRKDHGILVLAIKRNGSNIINPEPTEKYLAGDLLVLCGMAEQLAKVETVITGG